MENTEKRRINVRMAIKAGVAALISCVLFIAIFFPFINYSISVNGVIVDAKISGTDAIESLFALRDAPTMDEVAADYAEYINKAPLWIQMEISSGNPSSEAIVAFEKYIENYNYLKMVCSFEMFDSSPFYLTAVMLLCLVTLITALLTAAYACYAIACLLVNIFSKDCAIRSAPLFFAVVSGLYFISILFALALVQGMKAVDMRTVPASYGSWIEMSPTLFMLFFVSLAALALSCVEPFIKAEGVVPLKLVLKPASAALCVLFLLTAFMGYFSFEYEINAYYGKKVTGSYSPFELFGEMDFVAEPHETNPLAIDYQNIPINNLFFYDLPYDFYYLSADDKSAYLKGSMNPLLLFYADTAQDIKVMEGGATTAAQMSMLALLLAVALIAVLAQTKSKLVPLVLSAAMLLLSILSAVFLGIVSGLCNDIFALHSLRNFSVSVGAGAAVAIFAAAGVFALSLIGCFGKRKQADSAVKLDGKGTQIVV